MNELTFILAILIKQNVLTVQEAKALQKSSRENVTNASLSDMVTKVENALEVKEDQIKKIDATDLLKKD